MDFDRALFLEIAKSGMTPEQYLVSVTAAPAAAAPAPPPAGSAVAYGAPAPALAPAPSADVERVKQSVARLQKRGY
jgi:hypothetical protein